LPWCNTERLVALHPIQEHDPSQVPAIAETPNVVADILELPGNGVEVVIEVGPSVLLVDVSHFIDSSPVLLIALLSEYLAAGLDDTLERSEATLYGSLYLSPHVSHRGCRVVEELVVLEPFADVSLGLLLRHHLGRSCCALSGVLRPLRRVLSLSLSVLYAHAILLALSFEVSEPGLKFYRLVCRWRCFRFRNGQAVADGNPGSFSELLEYR
jgi:hypothetical protein